METIKKWKQIYIFVAAAIMLLGICLIIWPGISEEVLCYLFGVALLIVGLIRILCYFQRWLSAFWHRHELSLGLLDVLLGIYFFTHPDHLLLLLPVIIGVVIIVDSVFHLQTALELRAISVSRWWCILMLSVISIVAAIGLISNPFEGSRILMMYLGATLIVDSVQVLYFVHQIAHNIRKILPVEGKYIEL